MLSFIVIAQSSDRIDSDGDGVIDAFDNCPDTNTGEGLPIILRNPDFLGCSCSQIFSLMEQEYCKEVYCFPNRPLEIRNRAFSSRPNPCPSPRCEGNTLFSYVIDEIRCHSGKELPYECEEIIIENSDICINGLLDVEDFFVVDDSVPIDIYDLVVLSYLEGSVFVDYFDMRSKSSLINNNDVVLDNVVVEREVSVNERLVNNRRIVVADVSLVIIPDNYVRLDDFIIVERIHGDLSNKNLVINGDYFYDSSKQLILWRVDSLKDEVVFSYRITPGFDLDFEFFVQGDVKNTLFRELLLPLFLLTLLIGLVVSWIISMHEKNRVFKN
ncbi:hypothetical protein KO361_01610 [Candidatus Woesearchaeota archaeon]|nr:hypothetical protein [Candidatus Woesearchaeota archaeon]